MKRFLTKLILSITTLLTLSVGAYCAPPPVPALDAVQNYSGPIVSFWHGNSAPAGTLFHIYIATNPIASLTTAAMNVNATDIVYQGDMQLSSDAPFTYKSTVEDKMYYVRMAAFNTSTNEWSAATAQLMAKAKATKINVSSITAIIDGVEGYVVDFDSQTAILRANIAISDPFLSPAYVTLNIVNSANTGTSILTQPVQMDISVTVSSTNFSATVPTVTWDGHVKETNYTTHKHCGDYVVSAVATNAQSVTGNTTTKTITVDVVHINVLGGLIYTKTGSDANPHFGPPFKFNYALSKSAFVTWKIWDLHQTPNTSDDTLVKVVVSTVVRSQGDETSNPTDFDKMGQYEVWDGRDESGVIVGKDVYRYTVDVIEYWAQPGEAGFSLTTTDGNRLGYGTDNFKFAFDTLRFTSVASQGITDTNALAHLKYNLAGVNASMGGAIVKILICNPGTTFTYATQTGTVTYAAGVGQYYYEIGDPIPSPASNLKRVFKFARSAGAMDETWNGSDEGGNALANNNYVFVISATDDSGNHATDYNGNNHYAIGNVTIDRTAAEQSVDSTPPSVTAMSIGGNGISLTGGTILTQPFTTVAVSMADTGGSGVDLTNSLVTLTGPTTNTITVTVTNDNINTITLTCASQQSTNGTYIVRVRPRDKMGNAASDSIVNFVLATASSDVTPPTVTKVLVGGNSISLTGNDTLSQSFESISVTLTDVGGAGVDLSSTTITLVNPSTTAVTGIVTNNGTDTITVTFVKQSMDGVYTITITPKDKVSNTGVPVVARFTLSLAASVASRNFADSIYVCPNPAKGVDNVQFRFVTPKTISAKLEIYNIRGELVFEEAFTAAAASTEQNYVWDLKNQAGSKLATGVYLYRLFDDGSTSKSKKLKKIIIIQ